MQNSNCSDTLSMGLTTPEMSVTVYAARRTRAVSPARRSHRLVALEVFDKICPLEGLVIYLGGGKRKGDSPLVPICKA